MRPVDKFRLGLRLHEGAQHDQRRVQHAAVVFIGAQDPINQRFTVTTAPRGDQDIGFRDDFRQRPGGWFRRGGAVQITRVGHPPAHLARHLQSLQGIADLRQAIDPNFIVQVAQGGHGVLAPPFRRQHGGIIHDVAQAQHQAGAPPLQHAQGFLDLAAQTQRFLIDDDHVGGEDIRRMLDDLGPHMNGLFEIYAKVQRCVFAIAKLDHTGNADEIDPGAKVEAADDRRAGQDQYGQIRIFAHQGVGDGTASPQMAEAHGVVTIDQDAGTPHPFKRAFWHAPVSLAVQPLLKTPELCHAGVRTKSNFLI